MKTHLSVQCSIHIMRAFTRRIVSSYVRHIGLLIEFYSRKRLL
jgi:hypothetical protein